MAFKVLKATEIAKLSEEALKQYELDLAAFEAAAEAELEELDLKVPSIIALHGTVVLLSEWKIGSPEEGATFKHDTRIVTVSDLKDGVTKDVFITRDQWHAYSCESVIYPGNGLSFNLEDCIKGVTGYKETSKSTVMKAHTKSYKAFNRVVALEDSIMWNLLEQRGMSVTGIQFIMSKLEKTRANHDLLVQQAAMHQSNGGF